jgi:hypothetical protein
MHNSQCNDQQSATLHQEIIHKTECQAQMYGKGQNKAKRCGGLGFIPSE